MSLILHKTKNQETRFGGRNLNIQEINLNMAETRRQQQRTVNMKTQNRKAET